MKLCLSCQHSFVEPGWKCPVCATTPADRRGILSFAPALAEHNDGFNPLLFRRMAEIEPGHFWFAGRNRILAEVIRRYFGQPDNLLEIGCGTGYVLSALHAAFPGTRLSASDIYPEGLAFAAQRVPGAFLFQMDARHIPFQEEFDLIGAFDVLEHVEEDSTVLAQLYQACKPGGGIVLTVPQHRWLWSQADDFAHHKRRYLRRELLDKVTRAGFRTIYATSFVSLLLPLMLVQRLAKKSGTSVEQQMEGVGLHTGRVVNALLGTIMWLEWLLIKAGLALPAGGSLLVVARRPEVRKIRS